jgi:hypothetical protein
MDPYRGYGVFLAGTDLAAISWQIVVMGSLSEISENNPNAAS